MLDPRDLLDPARNYTQSENQPVGARIPEFAIRQLVGSLIQKAREEASKPVGFLDELYRSFGPKVIAAIKQFFREHPNIPCEVNWPRGDLAPPFISVVNMEGNEADSEGARFLADRGGRMLVDGAVRQQKVIGETYHIDVIICTQDPNLTLFVHNLVKFGLFSNKAPLAEFYDVHNLVLGARDLQWDQQMLPTFGYYKNISMNFLTMFDYNLPASGPFLVDFGLVVQADAGGVETLTEVPGDE